MTRETNARDPAGRPLVGLAAVGLAGVTAAWFAAGPQRFWVNWIFWFLFIATVALGALFIVALEHLVGARWSVPLRRTCERLSGLIGPSIPMGLIGVLSLPVLYPWTTEEGLARPMVAGKSAWLNPPFFAARVVLCLGLWVLSYRILVGGSLAQDQTKDPRITVRARRFAPVFMIIFGITITILAFDWISSLEPEWYSDVLGVYLFAGSFLAGLAATSLATVYLMRRGRLEGVRFDHVYNLGGFLFAFTVFWSYIAFAQYMLMWYANLPEEVFWYKERIEGPWLWVVLALAVVHFLIPFFALIARDWKGNPSRLRWVALVVLVSHALDLYWLMFPVLGVGPVFGWPEAAFALTFVSVSLLWIRRELHRGADMPVGDPFLGEALEYHL